MSKRILFILFVFCSFAASAQYNNEWINYNNTYYKFSVAKSGLYRIPHATLQTAGLSNTPAEQFQLWRNGIQVPLYTSVTSGTLGATDFIEFFGEINDGKPDTKLYRDINNQLSDKWSLETDTATFFLTVNPGGVNLRMVSETNDVAGNILPAEPYFMYTFGKYYKNKINPGYAGLVGEYVYSSVYDKGEGYTSNDIRPATPLSETVNNLFVYNGGPNGSFYVAGAGNALNNRNLKVDINNTQMVNAVMDVFNDQRQLVTLPVSVLSSGSAVVKITNTSSNPNDRMVVSRYEITYPRQFNFGGSTNFSFELPSTSTGNFLRITNFNFGGTAPVLYDLSNLKKYTGDISESGIVKFALPPSLQKRKLVLLNVVGANVNMVNDLASRNFIDYAQQDNHGDYLIISNPLLYNGPNGNPVDAYRQYRSSAPGGSFAAKVYDIDQLTDQFAFGIKRHPFAIKNFIKYASDRYQAPIQAVLLIGKGVNYIDAKKNEANTLLAKLNLVPSFGHPASDNLLAARDNATISNIPVGRISVVLPQEIEIYLDKVKEYEALAANAPQTVAARGWMKNIVHAIGGGDAALSAQIGGYMAQLKNIIEDTLYGGSVKSFTKSSAVTSELTSDGLKQLFAEGIGIVNYFGHSSASTLEFNIDDPYVYDNAGKYPFFLVNGCLAGDIFNFDLERLNMVTTLSEKYILAKERGSIGFIASSHFGVVNYLNSYLNGLYRSISQKEFGHSIGENLEESFRYLLGIWGSDFFARLHAEEITLHGDPAINFYVQPKPDYVIEDQLVKVPSLISVADNSFKVLAKFVNLGRSQNDSVVIEIKRQLPDGSVSTLLRTPIPGIAFSDSVEITVPINPAVEKGENKLILTIDADNMVDEMSESNNRLVKSFFLIDDGAKPIYPYNFSIVNTNNIVFHASTSNPIALAREYIMEIDTTELFNSPFKKAVKINASGGDIEFKPNVSFSDSTVYYWRTAAQSTDNTEPIWNTSSFIYLVNASSSGYNQSHYFQFQKSGYNNINLGNDRLLRFNETNHVLKIATGLYPYHAGDRLSVSIDETLFDKYGCSYSSLQVVVYDSLTMKPWTNSVQPDGFGRFGSARPCEHNNYTFEFIYGDTSYRRKAIEFLRAIPKGSFVSITNLGTTTNKSFISDWMNDTLKLGSGNSLYHVLKDQGLTDIDHFTKNLPFLFFFKKGFLDYPITSIIGPNENSLISQSLNVTSRGEKGDIESPWFGPAVEWQELRWSGKNLEPSDPDDITIEIYGRNNDNTESFITSVRPSHDTTLAFINTDTYPYLKIKMLNADSLRGTPHQLNYWRLIGKFPPEGAIAPNLYYLSIKDTVEMGEMLKVGVAFKNVSEEDFDSLKVKLILIDNNNVQHILDTLWRKPLISGDTLKIDYVLDTKNYPGLNTLSVIFNPDFDQPEASLLNNFLYKSFYVRADNLNPLLDVTFDGVHILNNDIVSSKPHILIKLKDDNHFLALDDTSLMKVQVVYPDRSIRVFSFNSDTLRFTPSPVTSGGTDNTATIDFNPDFFDDGDYELVVSGRDKSGNTAGRTEYRISFKIINKPMISNMFNYPNPFTSSTAFVFTLTGSEIPQNIRIQVLTITGKIVREITKEELGPIRIGRNITEFKWDGTDQYGQKLANGVYLYRVITNLRGKSLDKYQTEGDHTDQYFNKGYGKMYLMR